MKSAILLATVAGFALAACSPDATPEQRKHEFGCAAGTLSGAVVGGVLGSFVGDGTGQIVATGAGVALGSYAGNKLAAVEEMTMRNHILAATAALLIAPGFALAQDQTGLSEGHLDAADTTDDEAISVEEYQVYVKAAFAALDANGDGYVAWTEAEPILTQQQFDSFNTNGDDGISVAEIEAQAASDHAAADQDGDGLLNSTTAPAPGRSAPGAAAAARAAFSDDASALFRRSSDPCVNRPGAAMSRAVVSRGIRRT